MHGYSKKQLDLMIDALSIALETLQVTRGAEPGIEMARDFLEKLVDEGNFD